ncbi:MAG: rod shape-determining protein MreC, partial [Granulicella sp.]
DGSKEPGGVVPKPLQTLHSDHFTPGTTPPAVDLTPGAPASANPQMQVPTPAPPQRKPRTVPAPDQTPASTPESPQ